MSRLVCEARAKPEKMREAKASQKLLSQKMAAIEETATAMQQEDSGIQNALMVCHRVKETYDLEVTGHLVRWVMRQRCKFSFVKTKKLPAGSNTAKSVILRQQYALRILPLLERGTRIINIDETWLNETSFVRRKWAPRDGMGNTKLNTVAPRLSMIAAMDTEGRVWFSLSHSNTDSNVIITFLHHLV